MKKTFLGLGLVAVGAIAYFGIKGTPTTGTDGVEGTIGAAKRYQTEQIKTDDVTLDETDVNELIQSDLFHKLVTNEDFRKLVTSEEFQRAARSENFKGFVADPEVQRAYKVADGGKLFTTDGNKNALADDAVRKLVTGSPEFQKLSGEAAFGKFLAEPEVQKFLSTADGNKSLVENGKIWMERFPQVAKLVAANPDYARLVRDDGFNRLVASDPTALGRIGANPVLAKLLSNPETGRLLANPELGKLLATNPDAGKLILSPELGRLVGTSADFNKIVSSGDLGRFAGRPEVQKAVVMAERSGRISE